MLQLHMRLFALATLLLTGFFGGCGESHQTVEWYQEHKTERDEKLKWCREDVGHASDMDCMNARKAMQRTMISGPSAVETFHFNAGAAKKNESK